jgi:uncharacterized phage protein gp47/JayE
MSSSVFCYVDETGFHRSDYADIYQYFIDLAKSVFGEDIYIAPDSQDGQLLAGFAKAVYDQVLVAEAIYNSFSPAYAQSDALSRNVKINGIQRRAATYSTAEVLIIGQVGTTITNGQVGDALNQVWLLPDSVIVPIAGEITVTATARDIGAIVADANTITKILTPARGWQSVNNPAAATPGVGVETDAELRIRQTYSVALPAKTVFASTLGAVASVDGVSRYAGYENKEDETDDNGIPPHSIAIVVEGGDDQDIGDAIAAKKTPGTGTYGTTSVDTYDTEGILNVIDFFRPTIVPINVEITINPFVGYSSDYIPLIQESVANYINSLPIGTDVYITKLYTPAYLYGAPEGSTYDITDIQISRDSDPLANNNVVIDFNEAAFCDPETVVVVE